ncbi:MAG: hypothetical protein IPF77_15300 [Gemmatimonadetes bacterium]|nr:hypothetical protein [Gemmatimonadota bacterium]MBP9200540.1 hypothetical protein [Gemmatimonadales bacterium]
MTNTDPRDAALRAELLAAAPMPTLGAADQERLARGIAARIAREPAPAPPRTWRDDLIDLGRVVAPLAIAAGLAAVFLLGSGRLPASTSTSAETAFAGVLAGTSGSASLLESAVAESAGWLIVEGEQ